MCINSNSRNSWNVGLFFVCLPHHSRNSRQLATNCNIKSICIYQRTMWFNLYGKPLGEIMCGFRVGCHQYANDSRLYTLLYRLISALAVLRGYTWLSIIAEAESVFFHLCYHGVWLPTKTELHKPMSQWFPRLLLPCIGLPLKTVQTSTGTECHKSIIMGN